MEKIKVVIVDDEPFARKKIQTLMENQQDFEIVGEFENGRDALQYLPVLQPDVLFLDIQMPEMDGFEVLKNLQVPNPPLTVFVTAFDQYAIAAFEHHALDYLLKPFDAERFEKTLARVRENLAQNDSKSMDDRLQNLLGEISAPKEYLHRLMLKAGSDIYFLKVNEIDWIEAAGNYLTLYTGRKTHLMRGTMTNIIQKLDPAVFIRIHRSQIVNIDRIKKLQSDLHGDYLILLESGQELTLTRTYRDNLLKHFSTE